MALNLNLLKAEVVAYLKTNLRRRAAEFLLHAQKFEGIGSKELVQQLVGMQKSEKKLPLWFQNNNILYPPSLNLEQTSSAATAAYKSKLVYGQLLLDATGGFGVDSFYFSQHVEKVIHVERNAELQELAQHNFKALGANNVESYSGDGIKIALAQPNADWLYVDPSRRHDTKGKVFFLEDCEPNMPAILDDCLEKIPNILIKTAPILDISAGLNALKNVKSIHIVAVNNEVKELLWVIARDATGDIKLQAVNITSKNTLDLAIPLMAEAEASLKLGDISAYVYEPFASVMKTGAFNWLAQEYNVFKLHQHSHLYTSDQLVYFPGRAFKVTQTLEFSKKNMKSLKGAKANVVTRNFKMSVAQIRTKFLIKEAEKRYLFFTTNCQDKAVVIDCEKL